LNKFAPLVFVLLLSCGAALWFLASDSLNVHIKNQFQVIGSELTQQNLSIENVSIHGYQGTGTITNLLITPSSSQYLLMNAKATLSITSIDLVINRESLKKEIVIVDSITINGLNASFSYNEDGTSLENLLKTVQQNIQQFTAKIDNIDHKQQLKIAPPLVKVSKIIIKEGILNLINDKDGQAITETLTKIEFDVVGGEFGNIGEKIGIEIFEKLLIAVNKQTSMLQSKMFKII
jgi:hypothetical protein